MRRNQRTIAPAILRCSCRAVLAIALGLGATAIGDEADTAGPKILLLRGSRSSELDLASRRESCDTDAALGNRFRGDARSPDAPVLLPSPANNIDSPTSYPTRPLPDGLVSEPLRNFWTPGKDVHRPARHGLAIPASNQTGNEIQATSYISESLPRPLSAPSREEPHTANPPHELPRAEERDSQIPRVLLSISLVTSIAALGLAVAFRASVPRRDATIHVELASPPGTIVATAPSAHAATSAPEAVPARATTIADFAGSQFAAASLLEPTLNDQRHAEQRRQKAQESAILETLFEENLRLRQDLRKPAADSTAVSEI